MSFDITAEDIADCLEKHGTTSITNPPPCPKCGKTDDVRYFPCHGEKEDLARWCCFACDHVFHGPIPRKMLEE